MEGTNNKYLIQILYVKCTNLNIDKFMKNAIQKFKSTFLNFHMEFS